MRDIEFQKLITNFQIIKEKQIETVDILACNSKFSNQYAH